MTLTMTPTFSSTPTLTPTPSGVVDDKYYCIDTIQGCGTGTTTMEVKLVLGSYITARGYGCVSGEMILGALSGPYDSNPGDCVELNALSSVTAYVYNPNAQWQYCQCQAVQIGRAHV